MLSITKFPNAGTGGGSGIGTIAWSNPGNIVKEDGVLATADLADINPSSRNLIADVFGFPIPPDSEIKGIVVEIKRANGGGGDRIHDSTVQLRKAGAAVGTNKASSADWPGSLTYATYGDPNDLWGTTWTWKEVTATNFGVLIKALNVDGATDALAQVDAVRVTIYYNPPLVPARCRPLQRPQRLCLGFPPRTRILQSEERT